MAAIDDLVSNLKNGVLNVGQVAQALKAINFPQNVNGYIVASLPSSPTIGQMAYVTDGTSGLAWGGTVTGGHSSRYLVWFNGTNWTVIGE